MAAIREWYGLYGIIYNWFEDQYGYGALEEYWRYIAETVYPEVAADFREMGFPYIAEYFAGIMEADEGKATISVAENAVTIDIQECPDAIWQKFHDNGYFMPRDHYYKSYEVIYGTVARMAGLRFEMLRYDPHGRLKFAFTREVEA